MATSNRRHLTHSTAALLILALLTAGCNVEMERDVCSAAAGHLESCFGKLQSNPYAQASCNPDSAARLLSRSCKALSYAMMGGKADDLGLDEQIQKAIKDAIRQAIIEGVKQALNQVLGSLGSSLLKKYDFYLMLHLADSQDAAQAKADELRPLLASDPDMDPMVLKIDSGYAVIHGPCPLTLSSQLAEKIANMVADNPKLIEALGGTITTQTEPEENSEDTKGGQGKMEGEDGEAPEGGADKTEGEGGEIPDGGEDKTYTSNISISLPLALLPLPGSKSAKLGCQK